jgi:hypothetical protein
MLNTNLGVFNLGLKSNPILPQGIRRFDGNAELFL